MASSFKSKTHFLLVWPHLASKFFKWANETSKNISKNYQEWYQKTQNFLLISNLVKLKNADHQKNYNSTSFYFHEKK
jgi:hypothetical protein